MLVRKIRRPAEIDVWFFLDLFHTKKTLFPLATQPENQGPRRPPLNLGLRAYGLVPFCTFGPDNK